MNQTLKYIALGAATSMLFACGGEGPLSTSESAVSGKIPFRSLSDGSNIAGSKANLKRFSNSVKVTGAKTYLDPNQEVEIFFAIFNNPEFCTNGNPVTGVACGPPDLFIAETNGSLQFVGLFTAQSDGQLDIPNINDDTSQCYGAPFPCNPLTNPAGAEIHVPIFEPNLGPGVQAAQWE